MKHLYYLIIFLSVVSLIIVSPVDAQTVQSNEVTTKVGNAPENERPGGPANFVYYCQGDPKWSNICSLGKAGCGPTSLAMVISSYGVVMTPPQVDDQFRKSWRPSCGSGSDEVSAITSQWLSDLGFSHGPNIANGGVIDTAQLQNYLARGYLIIGSSKTFPCANCVSLDVVDHIFVVQQYNPNSNMVYIRDPNNCNYGNGVENQDKRSHRVNGEFPWLYAYPIIARNRLINQ